MPTSTGTLTFVTPASPAAVFARVSDLGGFAAAVPSGGSYRGTDAPDGEVRVGMRYVDRTEAGAMDGEVVALEPGRSIVYEQGIPSGRLRVRITYEVEPEAAGSRLTRTGAITTAGSFALAHPLIVARTRSENRRTMRALEAGLR